jgi:hypothetical protein
MTREQYVAIRKKFFPTSPGEFLLEMGFDGSITNLRTRAREYERGKRPIPRNVARFAWLLDQWSVQGCAADPDSSPDELPDWPEDL